MQLLGFWVLRILVPRGGQQLFIETNDFLIATIAPALGH
jgi:hypothetical protein